MNATHKHPRRICILVDGRLDVYTAKTALGLLRYCPDEVVAVIDRTHAGGDLAALVGVGAGVPIVADVAAATQYQPNQLIIGVALPGGVLPDDYRAYVMDALACGMDVVNGLHSRLAEDAELAAQAQRHGRTICDVRVPPKIDRVGNGLARGTRAVRVLTVGTDCNLGKRVTASELVRALSARNLHAEFIPTGQTGVMIAGWGVAIDGVVSDFLSGVVEQSVLAKQDADYVVVEGQGALIHPSYSSVTLGLMHGTLPDYFVVCHAPGRECMRHTDIPVATPGAMIAMTENLLAPIHPARCIGISLNCHGMDATAAAEAHAKIADDTGLPVVDSLRTGVEPLVDALIAARAK
jgi:uncharacterized NAD-dependent epimerase/dehydratase family protein